MQPTALKQRSRASDFHKYGALTLLILGLVVLSTLFSWLCGYHGLDSLPARSSAIIFDRNVKLYTRRSLTMITRCAAIEGGMPIYVNSLDTQTNTVKFRVAHEERMFGVPTQFIGYEIMFFHDGTTDRDMNRMYIKNGQLDLKVDTQSFLLSIVFYTLAATIARQIGSIIALSIFRFSRRRRGLCAYCKYDLGCLLTKCPECGRDNNIGQKTTRAAGGVGDSL